MQSCLWCKFILFNSCRQKCHLITTWTGPHERCILDSLFHFQEQFITSSFSSLYKNLIITKMQKDISKRKHHISFLFWKALQVSSNYFLLNGHFNSQILFAPNVLHDSWFGFRVTLYTCIFTVVFIVRMAHRLTSHHRALFSPKYLSGTSAHITTTSYFRTPFDVKDSDDFQKRVLASTKPVLVDFHAEYELFCLILKACDSCTCRFYVCVFS